LACYARAALSSALASYTTQKPLATTPQRWAIPCLPGIWVPRAPHICALLEARSSAGDTMRLVSLARRAKRWCGSATKATSLETPCWPLTLERMRQSNGSNRGRRGRFSYLRPLGRARCKMLG
ncbi:unnamed protein product, partial [Phaeothamnion confervicola]